MNDQTVAPTPLVLTPRKSELVKRLLKQDELLRNLVAACGSPLNLLLPDQLAANLKSFSSVFQAHNLTGRLFFAHKSNQSSSLLQQLAVSDVYADVSSLEELRHALACGFMGERLEATGPKSLEFLSLCLMHNLHINVDSLQELEDIQAVHALLGSGHKVRILLRLSGFHADHTPVLKKESRFGIPFGALSQALDVVASGEAYELVGFSFHLDSVSLDERLVAIENCLSAFEEAVNRGLQPRVLNIGGGFRISYLERESDWNGYTSALKQAVLGIRPPLTWQHNYFGLSSEGGRLRGKLNSYAYFEPRPGSKFLDDLLNSELLGYKSMRVADALRENMIELWIEPGRAVLDQCGVTVARVSSVRSGSNGDTLIGLGMKRQDLCFLDQEVFVDPVVVPKQSKASPAGTAGTTEKQYQPVYFTGHLCLESDLIFRHQLFLSALPQPGDLVIFINTAAYMMDFSSSTSIMQPKARRVAVVEEGGQFVWMLDEQYSPVWRLTR